MLTELFVSNLAKTFVVSGGSSAPAPGTLETLTVSDHDGKFPTIHRDVEQFHFKDRNPDNADEIMRCIETTGNSWLVERGADGTRPVYHDRKFAIRQVVPSSFFQRLGSGSTTELVNAVSVFRADPTGSELSDEAIYQALNSGPVYLPTGVYSVEAPINFLPGQVLLSFGNAIIRPVRGFTGDAAIELVDGPGTVRIEGITLDGSELEGGDETYGIFAETQRLEAELRGIRISSFTNSGAILSGIGWMLDRVTCFRNRKSGFEVNMSDSLLLGCRALENAEFGFSGYFEGQTVGCIARGNRIRDWRGVE